MQNIHSRTWVAISVSLVVIGYVFWQGVWSPIVSRFSEIQAKQPVSSATQNTSGVNFALPTTEESNQPNMSTDNIENIQNIPDNQVGIIDVKVGTGREARAGDTVAVHYEGVLTNGTKFDSSRVRGEPLVFTIGSGKVIQGFDIGVTGMKEGSVRKIVIPPKLGYGDQQAGSIPPNSTLLFEVELVKVK